MKYYLLLLLMVSVVVFGQKTAKTVTLNGKKMIIFEQPGDVMDARSYKVLNAPERGLALALGRSNEHLDLYDGLQVLLFEEGKYFYDGEIIRTPHDKDPRVIGVLKIDKITIPVVSFFDKQFSKSKESLPVDSGDTKIYEIVDEMPSYPGGMGALMSWLSQNIKYPVEAAENGVQGRVIVQFVVEKDGSITYMKVIQSVDPSLDKEAARVVSAMPKLTPGKQNGSAVRVKYTVPVTFKLQ